MTEQRDEQGRFAPGNDVGFSSRPQDINRAGRPKRPSITDALVQRLQQDQRQDGQASGREILDALLQSTIKEALAGSFPHLREIWNRLDGKESKGEELFPGAEPASLEEHKNAAVSLYRSIIVDPLSTPRDRLAAQESLNRLLGLVDGDGGNNAEETAAQVRAFLRETDVTNEAVEGTTPASPPD